MLDGTDFKTNFGRKWKKQIWSKGNVQADVDVDEMSGTD